MPRIGRWVSAVAIIAALLATVPAAAGAQPDGLSDVESSAHKPAIDALNELGMFEGTLCAEDTFCPSGPIDRSTMAVWLIRALEDEEPLALEESRFDDVDAAVWWAPHVERIAELGVTVGCRTEPLHYCPDRSVTRGQMATFLVRAFDVAPADPAGFTDTAGSVHESNINALAAARITAGCRTEPLQYCPERSVTRGQMATFLARALGILEVPGEEPQPPSAGSGEVQPRDAYIDVAAGAGHYCALRTDGTVECWGSYYDHVTGQYLEHAELPEGTFSSVSAGYNHMCGLRTDGTATCWGANTHGQARPPFARVGFSAIDAGNHHSCGLGVNGSITCWGANGDGQAVSQVGRFIAVDAGIWHTCGLRRNGSIYCWGSNSFGQIDAPLQGSFTAIAAGALHTCALRTYGTVTCWGTNNSGGYVGQTDAPGGIFTAISAGGWYTCGIRPDGTIECWGYLRDAAEDATTRTRIPAGTYTDVSAGWNVACAINDRSEVVCFP
ncbi:MAG: hypothetical protein OXH54_15230 [Acidimicrobiaceae bacterium]|nr:hypothetical protein [Acidimicrobiaceae bacterium]